MGYDEAWSALNLEMPGRIPRTEYSVIEHWPLIEAVTGIAVDHASPLGDKLTAAGALMRAWDFGLFWNVLVINQYFKGPVTSMGHAAWAVGGVDFDANVNEPFTEIEEVLAYDPLAVHGTLERGRLVADFEAHYRFFGQLYPDMVHMSGTYTTLFSGLINIFGWNMLLLAGGTDMRGFGELVQRYEAWMRQFFEAYADTDIPLMMVHDDIVWASGPVFPPDWYREFIFPAYKRLWDPVIESGKKIIYTSDGDYSLFLDDIVECGASCLVMEPGTDMAGFAERYGKTHSFIGNADTRVLLNGTRDEIRREVERCVRIGRECPGFIMAVGNHIAPNTPVENALYYNEVFEQLRAR